MCKIQAIVLKHLYMLLGFNQTDRLFQFTAQHLRESATFNVFLANLPQVLDQNHLIGSHILPFTIQVLLYAPYPINLVPSAEIMQSMVYSYSLWFLEQHVRKNWLMSVLTIFYKYQYASPPISDMIQNLVRIVMNSLDSQFHVCRRIPTTVVMDVPPRRDLSQPSLGTDPEERETPPASPIFPAEASSSRKPIISTSQLAKPSFRKYQDSSIECDETESELVAIPESDLSDSTLHGSSAPGSFDDTIHFDDIVAPLKPEIVKNKVTAHVKTANLSTAHVAMSPLTIAEKLDDKTEIIKKSHRITVTTSGPDRTNSNIIHSTTTTTIEAINTTSYQAKCSLTEGVRMMVASTMMPNEQKAILNPPVNVQKAVVVTQPTIINNTAKPREMHSGRDFTTATKMIASIVTGTEHFNEECNSSENSSNTTSNGGNSNNNGKLVKQHSLQDKPKALVSPNGVASNWTERRPVSPTHRTLGRQQRIIETSITPASTPTQQMLAEEKKASFKKGGLRSIDKYKTNYGSPESPLSKMDMMSPPGTDCKDGILSPSSIGHLEIPTPERLLPIGSHGKDGISTLVDRVREALSIPDISHLKQDSLESPREEGISVRDSRSNSPRRLTKQVALESPPMSEEVSSLAKKAQGLKIDKMSNAKEDTVRAQRQRFRKAGPFAMGSISISDNKAKFAGSWAPNQSHPGPGDSDDDEDDTQKTSGSDFQPVILIRCFF